MTAVGTSPPVSGAESCCGWLKCPRHLRADVGFLVDGTGAQWVPKSVGGKGSGSVGSRASAGSLLGRSRSQFLLLQDSGFPGILGSVPAH